ncbi:hypothetical protein MMPV_007715 [Pyropia vietnamensis]
MGIGREEVERHVRFSRRATLRLYQRTAHTFSSFVSAAPTPPVASSTPRPPPPATVATGATTRDGDAASPPPKTARSGDLPPHSPVTPAFCRSGSSPALSFTSTVTRSSPETDGGGDVLDEDTPSVPPLVRRPGHRRKPSVYVPLSVVSDESDCDDSSDRSLLVPGNTTACTAITAPVDTRDVVTNRVVDEEDTEASSGSLGRRPIQAHTRGQSTVVASEEICDGSPPAVPALTLSAPAVAAAVARAEAAAAVMTAAAPPGSAVGHTTGGPTGPVDFVKRSRPPLPAHAPVTNADLPPRGRGHRRRPSVWVPPQSSASDEEDA